MTTEKQRAQKRIVHQRWYMNHPTANAERNQRDRKRIREEIIALYGGKCQKCGYDTDYRALQIDHIYGVPEITKTRWHRGGVGLYRAILRGDYPKELFQLYCANCNTIKKFENKEYAKREWKYKKQEHGQAANKSNSLDVAARPIG